MCIFTANKVKKVWRDRQVLRVYFMNPDDIDDLEWKCRGEPLNTNTILAWAQVWNIVPYPEIPKFEMIERASRADIRVQFSSKSNLFFLQLYVYCYHIIHTGTGGSWSMVGVEATSVKDLKKPTMQLSLHAYSPDIQESLVIRYFGHALGLELEHQRSDFWDVLGKQLDVMQMKMDPFLNPSRTLEDGETIFQKYWGAINSEQSVNSLSEYDPDSIMHYR